MDYRVIQKWAPIMDSLKITDKQVREFLSEYAETHYIKNMKKENEPSLLPMSLKTLSMINLKYVNFEISKEDLPEIEYTFPIPDKGHDLPEMSRVLIIDSEVNKMVSDDINKKLESNDTLIVQDMISSLQFENGYVIVKSKYKLEERGNLHKVRQKMYDILKEEVR